MSDLTAFEQASPPEFYADATQITSTLYGFALHFGLTNNSMGQENRTVATVRMSPQHTKVLCQLMKKQLRSYEETAGVIALPDALYEELGIEKEI